MDAHFAGFAAALKKGEADANPGVRLQYEYLVTRYLVLCAKHGRKAPEGLQKAVEEDLQYLWITAPAMHWSQKDLKGIRARALWKLETPKVAKSYYKAIVDQDLYPVAMAADLAVVYRQIGMELPGWISDILAIGFRMFKEPSVFREHGTWLFQPGGFTDHPDYGHAGQPRKVKGMAKAPVPGIAWDTSHTHRFPLWLWSLTAAHGSDTQEGSFYRKVQKGLRSQFHGKVLVSPTATFPAYRTTNFMDGRNGVYRWNYKGLGVDAGYGPYELSATLLLGWWAFLGDEATLKMYRDSLAAWPFPSSVWSVYAGVDDGDGAGASSPDPSSRGAQFQELTLRVIPLLDLRN
jgi:hypothetical protein